MALSYTRLTFVTASERQPVAADGGLPHFYPLIVSTPEREAMIVEATRGGGHPWWRLRIDDGCAVLSSGDHSCCRD